MSQNTAVDLSRLPSPDVVEPLDFETIYAQMKAELKALDPDLDLRDSDPAAKVLQVCAMRELVIRQRINDSARAVMLAHATGADLDNIVAREPYNIARLEIDPGNPDAVPPVPPTMESDEALRRRAQLAPARYSTAGPTSAYKFHALGAHADVLDASVDSPAPTEVLVTVLSRQGDGVPDQAVLDAVAAALSAEEVRPLTDQVTVQPAVLVPFSVEAILTLYPGPDEEVVLQAAQDALNAYIEKTHRLGLDVSLSGLYKALHAEGVQRATLVQPAADVVVTPQQVSLCEAITITLGGRDE